MFFHHKKKTPVKLLISLFSIALLTAGIEGKKDKFEELRNEIYEQKRILESDEFRLNFTLIENGPPEFLHRQIEILQHFVVHVWCKKNEKPNRDNYILKDYVDLKNNKTTYYLHTFECIEEEDNVCLNQTYQPDFAQGQESFNNKFVNSTSGRIIFVKLCREYWICEQKNKMPVVFFSFDDHLYALGITDEELERMNVSEQYKMIKNGIYIPYKFSSRRDKATKEYQKTLTLEKVNFGALVFKEKIAIIVLTVCTLCVQFWNLVISVLIHRRRSIRSSLAQRAVGRDRARFRLTD